MVIKSLDIPSRVKRKIRKQVRIDPMPRKIFVDEDLNVDDLVEIRHPKRNTSEDEYRIKSRLIMKKYGLLSNNTNDSVCLPTSG